MTSVVLLACVRNHNPNQLQLPFSKEDLAAAFLVGTFSQQTSSRLDVVVTHMLLAMPSHAPFHAMKGYTLSPAKQVLKAEWTVS